LGLLLYWIRLIFDIKLKKEYYLFSRRQEAIFDGSPLEVENFEEKKGSFFRIVLSLIFKVKRE